MRLILLFFFIFTLSSPIFSQGNFEINITDLTNNQGQIVVLLFEKGQEFGMDKTPLKKHIFETILNRKASFSITNLATGEYAFLVFHDENKDGIFDTNWIGMPKEGVGKSGVQGKRPTYKNSKFVFTGEKTKFDIKLKYLL